jgi:hypothetical protein
MEYVNFVKKDLKCAHARYLENKPEVTDQHILNTSFGQATHLDRRQVPQCVGS